MRYSNHYCQKIEIIIPMFNDFCICTRNSCGSNHKLATKLIKQFGWKISNNIQKEYGISASIVYHTLMN